MDCSSISLHTTERGEIRNVDLECGDGTADILDGLLGERLVMVPDCDLGTGGDERSVIARPKPSAPPTTEGRPIESPQSVFPDPSFDWRFFNRRKASRPHPEA
jgi:hypothetical protein